METLNRKCVLILDETLPLGILANTAAILGVTLGKQHPEIVGPDVTDAGGGGHLGIVHLPVPVLRGTPALLQQLRQALDQPEYSDVTAVDFSDLAQSCNTYDTFIEKMAAAPGGSLRYFGLALLGDRKKLNRLTGSLPLLR